MNERSLVNPVRRFEFATLAPERWRNGGGWTRTVASASDGAGLLWRVSAADVEQDGPFSAFDGLDRTAVLMQGEGLALSGDGLDLRFRAPGDIARFPGEAALDARLPGGPARLWNVMVRRADLRAEVTVGTDAAPGPMQPSIAEALVVLAGRVRVCWPDGGSESVLASGEGLVLQCTDLALCIQPPAASPPAGTGRHAATPQTAAVPAARWIRTRILPAA